MANVTVLTINFVNADKLATVEAVLKGLGVGYGKTEFEVEAPVKAEEPKVDVVEIVEEAEEPVEEPKAEKKPAPKKESKKKSDAPKNKTKSDDGFDRELYLELGEHFGVTTKRGVARFARQTIYDAMSEVAKSKSGKLTKRAEKAIWKQLMAEAARFGEAWAIKMVEEAYAEA